MNYNLSPKANNFSAMKKLPTVYVCRTDLNNAWPYTEHLNTVMKPTKALKYTAHWILSAFVGFITISDHYPICNRPQIVPIHSQINPLNTKRRLLYLKTQFVPRSKHFSSRL